MDITLEGKTAVITGASSGLGKTLALDLARKQMNLVLAARSVEALNQIAAQVQGLGSAVLVQPTDVTDQAQCQVMIEKTIERFKRIDFLILNAGVSMWVRFDEITDTSILQSIMDTNYFGAVNCIYSALPSLRESHGTIVAVSSAQAVVGIPDHTGYSASKHALKGFLEALEFEMGDEIHVLNVMPGWVRGTNLRASAFRGDGTRMGWTPKHGSQAVSLEQCSAKIVRAMQNRRREIYIPSKLRVLPWLRLIAPGWLKVMVTRAVDRQEK